ncbi:MAG: hypothetical protein ACK4K7_00535 [Allosphingosinicella sp.]|uniref:hypothetical protein n=1 Tax=Allosphingosinicella sp. TaxID=2823234 RepID=UPI003951BEDC
MRHLLMSASLLLLAAACARSEDANLTPPEEGGYNTVEPVRAPEAEEQELALGEWRQSLQEEQQVVEFGPTGTEPLISIVCRPQGGVLLQRHGAVQVGGSEMMTVTLGGETRQLAVTAGTGTVPMLVAAVPSNEPMLQGLATNQEPITIRMGDGAPIIVPPSPLVGEFIRGCAADAQQAAGAAREAAPAAPADAGNAQ